MLKKIISLLSLFLFTLVAQPQNVYALLHPQSMKSSLVVAVVDTGADTQHILFKDSLWTNPGETGLDSKGHDKRNNHIDDDDNGYIDDIHGWNFVDDNNNVFDNEGHGTHVTGIIQSTFSKYNENSSSHIQFMILKYFDEKKSDPENIKHSNEALIYALKMKAKIVNYSGGGSTQTETEKNILKEIENQNMIFVAAAGNNAANIDQTPFYPASYKNNSILTVTATDQYGERTTFANYGSKVDMACPGKNIRSSSPGNRYEVRSGTSQATAYATGRIAAWINTAPDRKTSSAVNVLQKIKNDLSQNVRKPAYDRDRYALLIDKDN